jgi:hypothetical protein
MHKVSIIGMGTVYVDYTEYTSQNMLNAYTDAVRQLKTIFNKTGITAADYNSIVQQISNLQALAQNGTTDALPATSTNPATTTQTYLNAQMASCLENIMRSLSVVDLPPLSNAPPLSDTDKILTVQGWQQLPQYGVDVGSFLDEANSLEQYTVPATDLKTGLPTELLVQAFPTRSLQSALELEYVTYANELISTKLSNLESGLTLSQKILATLTNVQNAINQITVSPTQPRFQFPPSTTTPDPLPTDAGYASFITAIQANVSNQAAILSGGIAGNYSNTFATEINRLWASNPDPSSQDYANKQTLIAIVNNYNNPLNTQNPHLNLPLNPALDSSFPSSNLHQSSGPDTTYPNPRLYLIQHIDTLTNAALVDYHANSHNLSLTGQVASSYTNLNDVTGFKNAYEKAASAYFAQLIPTAVIPDLTTAVNNLKSLKTLLLGQIQELVALNPAASASPTVEGSFANKLFKLAQDISASFTSTMSPLSAVKKYILDGQDQTIKVISTTATQQPIQSNITNAISAASTLQESQREDVKRYMFIFQQFYKTTASMLETLSKMLEKITRGMSR